MKKYNRSVFFRIISASILVCFINANLTWAWGPERQVLSPPLKGEHSPITSESSDSPPRVRYHSFKGMIDEEAFIIWAFHSVFIAMFGAVFLMENVPEFLQVPCFILVLLTPVILPLLTEPLRNWLCIQYNLWQLEHEVYSDWRAVNVRNLGRYQSSKILYALGKTLRRDSSSEVRQASAEVIGSYIDPRIEGVAKRILLDALKRESKVTVQVAIIESLERIGLSSPEIEELKESVEAMIQSASKKGLQEATMQLEVIEILERMGFSPIALRLLTASPATQWLPPMGGKILLFGDDAKPKKAHPDPMPPFLTAEQYVKFIEFLRWQGELGKAYLYQLAVQGRLTDEFKYVAVALILASPYPNDWSQPAFKASWGEVAPLIHDGGVVRKDLNPFWTLIPGRTDLIQRESRVWKANLGEVEAEGTTLEDAFERLLAQVGDDRGQLQQAMSETAERRRFLLEARAYQRLALAFHAQNKTTPKEMSEELRRKLADLAEGFKQELDNLLSSYGLEEVTQVRWFLNSPRHGGGWLEGRYEADWEPIQVELIKLEEVKRQHSIELRRRATELLHWVTDSIDFELGLREEPPAIFNMEPPSSPARIPLRSEEAIGRAL